ncbi:MAG: alpha-hydroxy-acid oxidizing protein [Prevotellaceae bacterium]|jgi:isopentenyl diphosphate isomerase/L-lactate dehydrogenase-like FMN-dependent dehydrogenase|nr:alpha-hydroxy-acid oxidizing protein [Prevotellaceae bacterium]
MTKKIMVRRKIYGAEFATSVMIAALSYLHEVCPNDTAGVQKVPEDITEELYWAMNMTGSPDIAHIDPSLI